MNVPGFLELTVLAFAAYRITRLIGWDDWPPIVRVRARLLGETWVPDDAPAEIELPGKTPDSEVGYVRPAYKRPTLAHLFHCPYCLGWWVSLITVIGFWIDAKWTLYACLPFALSGLVGVITLRGEA